MFCMKCGTKLPDDAKFCYKCGNDISTINEGINTKEEAPISNNITQPQPIMSHEEQIEAIDQKGYMKKNPKTKKALLDMLKATEKIEYITMANEMTGIKDSSNGGAFIITNQRIMYLYRSMFKKRPDRIYPINTKIKKGKILFLRECLQIDNEKYVFDDNNDINTIIDIQSKITNIKQTASEDNITNFVCDIGSWSSQVKGKLYANEKFMEIKLKGYPERKISFDEIYMARAEENSIVNIYTRESIITMKVSNTNNVVAMLQKYIINLREFDFSDNKESTSLLPKIIKSNFPYGMEKNNFHIQIVRKYGRLVAPIKFDTLTEYFFFDVEELIKYDEKNFNSGLAAVGWLLPGFDSLKMGLSGKEYVLQAKLKSGYQCLVEAKDGMINITEIADINALRK